MNRNRAGECKLGDLGDGGTEIACGPACHDEHAIERTEQ